MRQLQTSETMYDYMKAYLDFFINDSEDADFKNSRAIVEKYKDYPISHIR